MYKLEAFDFGVVSMCVCVYRVLILLKLNHPLTHLLILVPKCYLLFVKLEAFDQALRSSMYGAREALSRKP
jgi:hypothetical protein